MASRSAVRLTVRLAILFAAGAGGQAAWSAGYLASFALCCGVGLWAIGRIASEALERRADSEGVEGHMLAALLERERETKTLTAFLDHAPIPLLAMRSRGALSAINLAARRIFATDDVVGDPPPALVSAVLGLEPGVRQSLSLEITGAPRTYALTIAEVVSEGDFVRIAALTDIQAEVQVAEAAALRDLMLVLSHEIMNSMTPVTSLAQSTAVLLRDIEGGDDRLEQAREAMESLSRRSEGLLRFVEGYRALARLPEPQVQPTNLDQLLQDMARLFRSRWTEHGVMLEASIEPSMRAAVDGALISQALLNVLTNAAEAALSHGGPAIVKLVAWTEGDGARIVVEDNGPGLHAEDPALVFRPFFTTKPEGSGIGLSITRQIILAHGGDIAAAPVGDEGARFSIRL